MCTRSLCCSTQICLHVSCCFFFLFYSLSYLLKQKKKKEKRTAPAWLTSLVREAHYLHRKRTNKKHTPALSAIDFDTSLEREETVCCVPFLIRSSRTPPGGQTPDAVKRTVQQVRIQHSSPFFLDLFQWEEASTKGTLTHTTHTHGHTCAPSERERVCERFATRGDKKVRGE